MREVMETEISSKPVDHPWLCHAGSVSQEPVTIYRCQYSMLPCCELDKFIWYLDIA